MSFRWRRICHRRAFVHRTLFGEFCARYPLVVKLSFFRQTGSGGYSLASRTSIARPALRNSAIARGHFEKRNLCLVVLVGFRMEFLPAQNQNVVFFCRILSLG
jgi:hypothetical protein